MEVWNLAKNNLDAGKDDHERIVIYVALVSMSMFVKTVRPLHRPNQFSTNIKQ